MVESLSMASSSVIARAASSAAALASTLYSLIADIRDPSPPREIRDVAGELRDLSNGLRELRNILQKVDRGVFRSGFFASTDSLLEQIQVLLGEIRGLVTSDDDGNASRTLCSRWKTRATRVLVKTESLKLAVWLVVRMMSLVWEQDMQSYWTREEDHPEEEDERLVLRTQVKIIVQAIKQSIKDASSPNSTTRDAGTQTDELHRSSSTTPTDCADPSAASVEQPPDREHHYSMEVERAGQTTAEEDTARWLHNFVFGDVVAYDLNHDSDLDEKHLPITTLISENNRLSGNEVIDRLLRSWSRLNEDEIQELRDLSPPSEDSTAGSHDRKHDLTRASVHQIMSKALSYARYSNTHKSSRDDRPDSQPHVSSRRRASQDDSKELGTRVSVHANKADVDRFRQHDRREAQQNTNPESRPPQHHQNTSRHRSRPSWVLGPRRARSRSSERRVATVSAAAAASAAASASSSASANPSPAFSSSRSRFIGWRSQQAKRFLDTSSVSHSSSSSSIDKRVQKQHQQPPRISQHNPPQKVLFTFPVARLASSSTTTTTTASTSDQNNTSLTTRRHSTSRSSPTSPSHSPRSSSSHTSTTTTTIQPTKGILKPPTHHFPEESNPVREGVAPHKADKTKRDVAPPGAKWTKIKRSWVNPEALTIGKERFEVLGDHHVKVLRVLSREEIEAYRIATAQLRAMREGLDKEEGHEAGTDARPRRRSGGGGGSKEGEGRRESSGGNGSSRYAGQGAGGNNSSTGRKRSPSPRRKRDSGNASWVLVARST